MKHMSAVVQQLNKERERAQNQVQRIDVALTASGSVSSNGASSTISAAARRRTSLAQNARWAKQKGSQAEEDDISGRSQAHRGGTESQVGKGKG